MRYTLCMQRYGRRIPFGIDAEKAASKVKKLIHASYGIAYHAW
jgi:hypothetical protein